MYAQTWKRWMKHERPTMWAFQSAGEQCDIHTEENRTYEQNTLPISELQGYGNLCLVRASIAAWDGCVWPVGVEFLFIPRCIPELRIEKGLKTI